MKGRKLAALISAASLGGLILAVPAHADEAGFGNTDPGLNTIVFTAGANGNSLGGNLQLITWTCTATAIGDPTGTPPVTPVLITMTDCYFRDSGNVKHSAVVPVPAPGAFVADAFTTTAADGPGEVCVVATVTDALPLGGSMTQSFCEPIG